MRLYLLVVLAVISKKSLGCREQFRFVELDHQRMVFNSRQKIVTLKNSRIQACSSFALSLIQECNTEVVHHQWTINGSSQFAAVSVDSLTYANSLLLFNLSTTNSCPLFPLYFQIVPEVTTSQLMINPHGFTCINFNTQAYPGALYIVIPSKNNCKSDCVCPVVLIADQDCQNFQMCSCIMDTHFNDSLRICSTTQSYLQLCISNVTSGMNNTNVHLYTQRYTTCAPSYRKYVKAFKIIIRDIYSITFKTVTSTDRYNYIGVTGQTSTENLSRLVLSHTSEITRATDSEADLKTTIQGPTSNSSDTKLASDKKSPPSVRGTSILPIYVIGIVTTATCFTVIVIVIGVIIAVRKGKKQSPIHIYDDIGCIRESSGRHSQLHHTLSDESPTMTRNPIYNYQY